MHHAVHLNNARAAPRSFSDAFPAWAASWRAAVRGFAFGCLLARHRFPPKKISTTAVSLSVISNYNLKENINQIHEKLGWKKVAVVQKFAVLSPVSWTHLCWQFAAFQSKSENVAKRWLRLSAASCSWCPSGFRTTASALSAAAASSACDAVENSTFTGDQNLQQLI